jgi:ribonuclease HI
MAGTLHLYTDASVRGRMLGASSKRKRSRRGPAFGAWCGWHGEDFSERPTTAGQAYLGDDHGTQTAEYMAVVYGLGAAVAYGETRVERIRPHEVVLYVDNLCVYNVLTGEWTAREALGSIHRRASALSARLHGLGMPLGIVKVAESDPTHKIVHTLTQGARNQVLLNPAWRPDAPPPKPAGDDDIPF